jgi:transcriptional regulator with XRE-family HTH domain
MTLSIKRGRPASPTEGARRAVAIVRDYKKSLKISDKQLADALGINQSSVSRALGRDPPILSPSLLKLCNYAKNNSLATSGSHFHKAAKSKLAEEVNAAWDGTPMGLNRLVAILQLLGQFGT